MEFANLNNALKVYGNLVVQEAKKNLQAPIKKGRHGWTGKTDNTGNLSRSLAVKQTPCGIDITMLDYGQAVNEGRKAGKGVPPAQLLGWVNSKLKPDEDPKSLTYMINRSIKLFGIAPTHFLDNAFETVDKMDIPELQDALFEDLMESLKEKTC